MKKKTTILDKLDRRRTQRRVEEALETARIYKTVGFLRREAGITSSYDPRYHGKTNRMAAQTEQHAVWNVDAENRMRAQTEQVEKAVYQLNEKQREIIQRRYLVNETSADYLVWPELGLSERQYYRVKAEAFLLLALMLNLEVQQEEPIDEDGRELAGT